ncbi:MAG: S24 family peptidase [Methylocella sp.]
MDIIDLETIRRALEKPGKSKKGLAEALGRFPSAVTSILKGTRELKLGELAKVTAYLEIAASSAPKKDHAKLEPRPPRGFHEDGVRYISEAATGPDAFREAVAHLLSGRPDAHAWTMKSDVLALMGVSAGDVVIIDQSVVPKNGDIVCAQVEDGLGAKTLFRVYQMPNLVGAGFDPSAVRPETVDGERVRVVGVMTELLRRRASG